MPSPTPVALYTFPLMLISFPTEIITPIVKMTLKLSRLHNFFIFTSGRLLEKVSNLYLSFHKVWAVYYFPTTTSLSYFYRMVDRGNSQVVVSLRALRSPGLDSEPGG